MIKGEVLSYDLGPRDPWFEPQPGRTVRCGLE